MWLFSWNFNIFHLNVHKLGLLEFRCHRKWSLNRQSQCKNENNYQVQTPQNLAITKIFQKFRKTSTSLSSIKMSTQCKTTIQKCKLSTFFYWIRFHKKPRGSRRHSREQSTTTRKYFHQTNDAKKLSADSISLIAVIMGQSCQLM